MTKIRLKVVKQIVSREWPFYQSFHVSSAWNDAVHSCAARAFYDCPAIISHRPRSQNISKEAQLNPEKDSRIKRARSPVSLEKSSQNYKPLDKWAKPNLILDVTPHPSQCLGECIWPRGESQNPRNHLPNSGAKDSRQDQGGGRGDLRFDISH